MEAVARGDDPKGLIRNAEANRFIDWPFAPWRKRMVAEFTRSEYLERRARFNRINAVPKDDFFGFYAGQPDAVREEFKLAMGLTD
jgi:hypothetical protein